MLNDTTRRRCYKVWVTIMKVGRDSGLADSPFGPDVGVALPTVHLHLVAAAAVAKAIVGSSAATGSQVTPGTFVAWETKEEEEELLVVVVAIARVTHNHAGAGRERT